MSSHPAVPAALACSRCGATGSTNFCAQCGHPLGGEAAVGNTRALLQQGAAELLGLEGRVLATVRDGLIRPVRLTRACLHGGAGAYVPPLKMFFALGGAYMLLLSLVQPFSFDPAALAAWGVEERTASGLAEIMQEHGISRELADERFQSRMNTVTPLAVALALLPLGLLLRALDRQRTLFQHLVVLLCLSNSVWLASMLLLPIAGWSMQAYSVVLFPVTYGYLAAGFVALYPGRTRWRTAGRLTLFLVADLALTSALSVLLMAGIALSVLGL